MSHSVTLVVLALVASTAASLCEGENEVACQYEMIHHRLTRRVNHQEAPIYSCYRCNLTHITEDTFHVGNWTTELKEIHLADTKILTYNINTFANLTGLETLSVTEMGLTEIYGEVAIEMINLKNLQILGNNISHINGGAFMYTPNLERLMLAYNRIRVIDKDAFNHPNKLIAVNLAFNLITTIHTGMFHNLHHLKFLSIEQNPIFYIDFPATMKSLSPSVDFFLIQFTPCETIKRKVQSHIKNRWSLRTAPKYSTDLYEILKINSHDKKVGIAVKSTFKLPEMYVWWAGEIEQVPCFYSYPEHYHNYHFRVKEHRKRGQDAAVLVDATRNLKQVVEDITHYSEFVKDKKTATIEKLLHDVVDVLKKVETTLENA